jgi:molybdopterin-guanine dinucleotide biosynthesis protein A
VSGGGIKEKEPRIPRSGSPGSLTGGILAGGFSRRLGQDKAALLLGGKPLARWVAEALAPVAPECWLITNHPRDHLALGLPLVTDLYPFQGPAGGLLTALFYARTPWVLAAAVDNPFLTPELVAALTARMARTSQPAVVCQSPRGLEPFPGLYHVRLLLQLTSFLKNDLRPTRFLSVCRPEIIPPEVVLRLDPADRSFFNLNTPADLVQAEAWLAREDEEAGPRD